jgi:hypothetical protein
MSHALSSVYAKSNNWFVVSGLVTSQKVRTKERSTRFRRSSEPQYNQPFPRLSCWYVILIHDIQYDPEHMPDQCI